MDDVVSHCRAMTEKGSKSFAVAARLLSPEVRDRAYMLYAWCRRADDEIDGQELGFLRQAADARPPAERLAELRAKTERALEGDADEPEFKALARVARECQIPARHPLELIHGFEMDVGERRYLSLEDTLSYCYHVAGVVGVMMAMVMGERGRDTLNRASDLGIAFQLTNIARDVVDDAAAGRVYLPADWLAEANAGADPAAILDPANRDAIAAVAARLLAVAEDYYASARVGLRMLPFQSALAVAAARQVYRAIGVKVKRRGARAWERRAIVGRAGKLAAVAMALAAAADAHSLARLRRAAPRQGLWTHPGLGV